MSTQTPRTLTQLLAQLPDNTSGLITAQDVRDVVVSLYPSRGQIKMISGAQSTTFTEQNVYVPIVTTTAVDVSVCTGCVEMPGNGQLRFTKPIAQVALVNATLSVLPAGNNTTYSFTFAINGAPVDLLHLTQSFGNLQGRPFGIFLSGLVRLQPNDIVSLVVRADGHTTAISTSVLTLSALGVMT
jgi:hypothetical protein